ALGWTKRLGLLRPHTRDAALRGEASLLDGYRRAYANTMAAGAHFLRVAARLVGIVWRYRHLDRVQRRPAVDALSRSTFVLLLAHSPFRAVDCLARVHLALEKLGA